LNKLAVLAFTLLLFLSTMLWYLADGSLNDYLKSQIQLQGHYYTKQQASVTTANYVSNSGIGQFSGLTLANPDKFTAEHALIIDRVNIELVQQLQTPAQQNNDLLHTGALQLTLKHVTIEHLIINSESLADAQQGSAGNIKQLINQIQQQLAQDYPQSYGNIAAKAYAQKNPDLDAVAYAESHPQTGPIVEHTKTKKKRGKPQTTINITKLTIKQLTINETINEQVNTRQQHNVQLPAIGAANKTIVTQQLGGEVLLALLTLAL